MVGENKLQQVDDLMRGPVSTWHIGTERMRERERKGDLWRETLARDWPAEKVKQPAASRGPRVCGRSRHTFAVFWQHRFSIRTLMFTSDLRFHEGK